jgi:hypothetical protein
LRGLTAHYRLLRGLTALSALLCAGSFTIDGHARSRGKVHSYDGQGDFAPPAGSTRRELQQPGAYEHDGFYFRFSTGIGGYIEVVNPVDHAVAARTSGIGGTVELGAGGTVARGWVLGLGAYFLRPLASDVELSDGREEALPKQVVPTFRDSVLLGPLVDWYPDVRDGLHFQGAIGWVHLSRALYTPGDFSSRAYAANGIGALLGLGQEWWTSPENSIGVTTQFTLSTSWGELDDGGAWHHLQLGTPTFVFTWTHH